MMAEGYKQDKNFLFKFCNYRRRRVAITLKFLENASLNISIASMPER
jgi:hypothetical protein